MKDNFSQQSELYAQFRPNYPEALFEAMVQLLPQRKIAWDCGTGNGQVAVALAPYFEAVFGTDISEKQLEKAPKISNVNFFKESAEHTRFPDQFFDLITVAQAIHWFQFDEFYAEVKRTLRPDGLLAVIGYNLCRTNSPLDTVIDSFYTEKIGQYWDKERKYIDDAYETIPFPFKEVFFPKFIPPFTMEYEWTFEMFLGYLNTWSAVQHYKNAHGTNPVTEFSALFEEAWGNNETRLFQFLLLLRMGKLL